MDTLPQLGAQAAGSPASGPGWALLPSESPGSWVATGSCLPTWELPGPAPLASLGTQHRGGPGQSGAFCFGGVCDECAAKPVGCRGPWLEEQGLLTCPRACSTASLHTGFLPSSHRHPHTPPLVLLSWPLLHRESSPTRSPSGPHRASEPRLLTRSRAPSPTAPPEQASRSFHVELLQCQSFPSG